MAGQVATRSVQYVAGAPSTVRPPMISFTKGRRFAHVSVRSGWQNAPTGCSPKLSSTQTVPEVHCASLTHSSQACAEPAAAFVHFPCVTSQTAGPPESVVQRCLSLAEHSTHSPRAQTFLPGMWLHASGALVAQGTHSPELQTLAPGSTQSLLLRQRTHCPPAQCVRPWMCAHSLSDAQLLQICCRASQALAPASLQSLSALHETHLPCAGSRISPAPHGSGLASAQPPPPSSAQGPARRSPLPTVAASCTADASGPLAACASNSSGLNSLPSLGTGSSHASTSRPSIPPSCCKAIAMLADLPKSRRASRVAATGDQQPQRDAALEP